VQVQPRTRPATLEDGQPRCADARDPDYEAEGTLCERARYDGVRSAVLVGDGVAAVVHRQGTAGRGEGSIARKVDEEGREGFMGCPRRLAPDCLEDQQG